MAGTDEALRLLLTRSLWLNTHVGTDAGIGKGNVMVFLAIIHWLALCHGAHGSTMAVTVTGYCGWHCHGGIEASTEMGHGVLGSCD